MSASPLRPPARRFRSAGPVTSAGLWYLWFRGFPALPMVCASCSAENDEDADNCFRCGKGLYVLTEGHLLAGRYEILKTVGRGGMGIVYKAHDRELDEDVAVKLLRAETLRSKDALRRLKAEVRLARRIRHRNVGVIHELLQEGPLRFVVMEFVDGVDLKQVLRKRGRLPAPEALPILLQAAAGLGAIHEAGIVHRDLKTPNIMLDHRGVVRLMDFGIAKRFGIESEAGGTATGSVVGTPEYMSPEQIRGEKLDARSDLYALGIVVYELLTGFVPFKGDTPLATIFKQIEEPPPLEGERARYLPASLVPILRRMLVKDRDERMATAQDFILAVEAVQAQTARHAAPSGGALTRHPVLLTAEAPDDEPEPSTAATPVPTAVPTQRRSPVTAILQKEASSARDEVRDSAPPASAMKSVAPSTGAAALASWAGSGLLAVAVAGVIGWSLSRGNADVPEAPPSVARTEPATATTPSSSVPAPALQEGEPPAVREAVAAPRSSAVATSAPRPATFGDRLPPPTPRTRPARVFPAAAPGVRAPNPTMALEAIPQGAPSPSAVPPTTLAENQSARLADATGRLQVVVRPWAEVMVDGKSVGASPLILTLSAGPHTVKLVHPEYQTFVRRMNVRPSESVKLEVDLPLDGVRK